MWRGVRLSWPVRALVLYIPPKWPKSMTSTHSESQLKSPGTHSPQAMTTQCHSTLEKQLLHIIHRKKVKQEEETKESTSNKTKTLETGLNRMEIRNMPDK